MKNPSKISMVILPVLACFALLPGARAACLDGCNSSLFNVFQGDDALSSNTTGSGNTAFGWRSLFTNTDGSFNTAIGGGALVLNTDGSSNTAVGAAALLLNTTGSENTAVGTDALVNNTVDGNTATGSFALFANTTGGTLETVGMGLPLGPNVAIGTNALQNNVDGSGNTAVGYDALQSQVHGDVLEGLPQFAINTAVGFEALANLTGSASGGFNGGNTALGYQALFNLTDGFNNIAIGAGAGSPPTGTSLTFGSNNIFIGRSITPASATESNNTYIGNIAFTPQPFGGTVGNVTIDQLGGAFPQRLGIDTSSRRYKEDIKPMDKLSETLFKLKPVSYRIKKGINPMRPTAFGLIAEDVEEANPDLVLHNAKGQPEGVHYQMVNAMLLNEFLKEHQRVEQLQATVAQQQKDFQAAVAKLKEAVTAQLNEQAAQIQRVSAQLEMSKPAAKMVVNKP